MISLYQALLQALIQAMEEKKEKRSFGGKTSTSWDAKWHSGKTRTIRVPVALADHILKIAKAIDAGKVDADDILELVK